MTTLAADGRECGSGWAATPSSSLSGAWPLTRILFERPQQKQSFGGARSYETQ